MICAIKYPLFSIFILVNCLVYSQMEGTYKVFYQQQKLRASFQQNGLVKLNGLDQNILVQLPYATDSNVFNENFYVGLNEAYLVPEGAEKLMAAASYLRERDSTLFLLV